MIYGALDRGRSEYHVGIQRNRKEASIMQDVILIEAGRRERHCWIDLWRYRSCSGYCSVCESQSRGNPKSL
jgi:hypothetical protein